MKKQFRFIALVMVLILSLSLASCGGNAEPEATDDGQNPVMNFIGNYVCDRAQIFISAEDEDNSASAVVTWGSSAWENSSWIMTGTFDSETLQFEYHDCVRTDYVYKENGDVESQEEVYKGGHGFMTFTDGDPITLTWQDDQENVAEGMVFEYVGVTPEDQTGVGMANPWQTADSIEAAAEGAGLDLFTVPEGAEISLGEVKAEEYRYMDGLAEVYAPFPAVDLTIRKGKTDVAAEPGDISGDYNSYANTWTQNIKGLEVTCFGNTKGDATKTIWTIEDYSYSITAYGLGGETDYGLSPDDLNSLINGIQ